MSQRTPEQSDMTREEVKDRLAIYPSQILRQVADSNHKKAEEAEVIAQTAEEIIKERHAA